MPETPTIATTSLLTTVLSCAKPYNGRKKAASSAVVKGKVRRLAIADCHANLALPWQPRTGKAKRAIKRAADPSGFESGMKHTIRKQTKAAEKKKRLTAKVLSTAHPPHTNHTQSTDAPATAPWVSDRGMHVGAWPREPVARRDAHASVQRRPGGDYGPMAKAG